MGIRPNASPKDDGDPGYTSDEYASAGYTSDEKPHPRARATTETASQGGSVFSDDVLKIEICGPSVDYLTVIDVPGIFRTPTDGVTTKEDMNMVRDMVRRYIRDSRTVILAVLPCNIDISTQEILTLAEEYDKKGERTLGILTKPDLATEASTKALVCNIVRGKKKQLKLGYYVVRSRGADQDDAQFRCRENIFKEAPWNSLPPERVGVKALKARLAELLGHIARREFPKLRKDISEMLHSAERERDSLGPSRKDEHEQGLYLSAMAREFQDLVRAGLEGQYSGDNAFERSAELRLITQVVNLADVFSEEFEIKAALRRFESVDGEVGPKGARLPSNIGQNIRSSSTQAIEPDDFPELENLISQEYDVEDPEGDIMNWIEHLYMRSRGMDLGGFSNTIWTSAFKEQSSKWSSMSKAFMSRVVVAIHRFITRALDVVCVDPSVRYELWSAMFDELLRRYEAGMAAADFLLSAERETKPYTLDRHFNEYRQKCRGSRIAELLGPEDDVVEYGGPNKADDRKVTIREVRTATEEMSNFADIVERLHDDLSAYYEIARRRFVDNVLNQAVNYRLLFGPSTPLGVFSQEWVIELGRERLEAIAGESPSTREHREQLDRKIEDLKAAKEILRQ